MPKITKEWVAGLDRGGLEKILALGRYNRSAILLSIHADEWFHAHFEGQRSEAKKQEVFWLFFLPYYFLWVSMLYVVHEGLVELEIEDAKLRKIREHIDMALLKRFRNATFHFQPKWRSSKHDDFIMKHGLAAAWELSQRQDFLVRKMARLVKFNPHSEGIL